MRKLKWLFALSLPVLMISCQKEVANNQSNDEAASTVSGSGNGGPNGAHYQINIIGVPKNKTADMSGNNGRRIFVKESGSTKIMLTEGAFAVLDANGTDGSASFQLPDPSDESDPVTGTSYSVYVRALGKPGGKVGITTCATIVDGEDLYTGVICSEEVLKVERKAGRSKFTDVSRYLLTMYVDITNDGEYNPKRYNLFDPELQDYYWNYDNNGLKILQMRFYPIPSSLPL